MVENLAALQIVVPLLAAPISALIPNRRAVHAFGIAITMLTFAIAIGLAQQVSESGPFSYAMGGWKAPMGIEYRVDVLTVFVLLIVSGISAVVMAYARESQRSQSPAFVVPVRHWR